MLLTPIYQHLAQCSSVPGDGNELHGLPILAVFVESRARPSTTKKYTCPACCIQSKSDLSRRSFVYQLAQSLPCKLPSIRFRVLCTPRGGHDVAMLWSTHECPGTGCRAKRARPPWQETALLVATTSPLPLQRDVVVDRGRPSRRALVLLPHVLMK